MPRESTIPQFPCVPKQLPDDRLVEAMHVAMAVNPANGLALHAVAALSTSVPLEPLQVAVLTQKFWGPKPRKLGVRFLERTPADLKARILEHANRWDCAITFAETSGKGDVRLTREQSGYWSYLGTDILSIPAGQPTLCLQGFTMQTPEPEFRRVVPHEFGHTLGFPHEHQRKAIIDRLNPEAVYRYYGRLTGWPREMIRAQILTPIDERLLKGTRPNVRSIMAYWFPEDVVKDHTPIPGGSDLIADDLAFADELYPTATSKPPRTPKPIARDAA